jgi:glucose-6-phosphate 1-dehydrogenase
MSDVSSFSFVIFGATGDLTKRKLIPSLYSLFCLGLLPTEFRIWAFARRPFTSDSFCETLLPFIEKGEQWDAFAAHVMYVQGDFNDPEGYQLLKNNLETYERQLSGCPLRLYYMAVAPTELPTLIQRMGETGLHVGCSGDAQSTRIVIEKPFGHDLLSAQQLNADLKRYFTEEQIYRIDHYLGKETVQNILPSTHFSPILAMPCLGPP